MSKSLQVIQTLSKVGKILCKIVFICSIIGIVGCVVGIVSLALIPEGIVINGKPLQDFIFAEMNLSVNTMYAIMASSIVILICECVICKFSEKYFNNELKAGTPFTFEGAKELLKLGIITVSISIGSLIVSEIVVGIMTTFMPEIDSNVLTGHTSASVGIMFIVLSVIFKYGAEQASKTDSEIENNNADTTKNKGVMTEPNDDLEQPKNNTDTSFKSSSADEISEMIEPKTKKSKKE